MQAPSRLKHFPIAFFAMVMGLAGLTIAWEKAQVSLGLPFRLEAALLPLTALVFLLLSLFYAIKLIRYRDAVLKELQHPVKLNFFPTISISLILLSIATLSVSPLLSKGLWMVGAGLHLLFTLYITFAVYASQPDDQKG